MMSRRLFPFSIYLLVLVCFPVLAQKKAIDPALQEKANAGDARAQLTLGEAYLSGISVQQDYTKAATWLQKAADQGQAQAQFDVGSLYQSGLGVPQNDARAAALYRKAAEQGFAPAE